MKCPIDQTELTMTERQGIEIDYCPKCRGVWLDRGELDKLIERSAPAEAPRAERTYQQETRRKIARRDTTGRTTKSASRCSASYSISDPTAR